MIQGLLMYLIFNFPWKDHSSSTTNSSSISTLSGSFSSGDLAYLPPVPIDHCVPSITCSCSIGALDQIRSTEITKLFDHLFLGSQKDALDIELLQRHGITKVNWIKIWGKIYYIFFCLKNSKNLL